MKTKLLYIGNKLSIHGNTATSIETLGSLLEIEGYQIEFASSKKNKVLRIIDMVSKTIKYSKKINIVLIDVYSTQNFWYAFIISRLCSFLRLKYIAKLRGGNLPQRLKNNPFLCQLIFKNAYKLVAPSNYLKSEFSKHFNDNLVYIPNTIEIKNYPLFEKSFKEPKLLWVRSFSKIYNPKMAIDVLADLKSIFPNASLCMVGPDIDGSLIETKDYASKLNLEVTFTGKLSKKEWIERSKEYNVFINTTHFDNTPVSVMEAMALSFPVVSTNVGGIPFLLTNNENALLVQDSNVSEMSNAIKYLFENPDKAKTLSLNARKLAENFDWNVVKNKWLEILK